MIKAGKLFGGLFLVVGMIFTSCDELSNQSIDIDLDKTSVEFVITPTDEVGYQVFASSSYETNVDSILSAHGYSASDLSKIAIKSVELELVSSTPDADACFDIFESVEAKISTDIVSSETLAMIESIPEGATNLNCDIVDLDYSDFLLSKSYTLEAAGTNKVPVTNTMVVKGTIQFTLKIEFLNSLASF